MNKDTIEAIGLVKETASALASLGLTLDAEKTINEQVYDGDDLINATLIMTHIVGNIAAKHAIENHGDKAEEVGMQFGRDLREFILKYTGLDTFDLVNQQTAQGTSQNE